MKEIKSSYLQRKKFHSVTDSPTYLRFSTTETPHVEQFFELFVSLQPLSFNLQFLQFLRVICLVAGKGWVKDFGVGCWGLFHMMPPNCAAVVVGHGLVGGGVCIYGDRARAVGVGQGCVRHWVIGNALNPVFRDNCFAFYLLKNKNCG